MHSIGAKPEFEDEDRKAATTFAEQAKAAGVRRIVYLGGLTPEGEELSPHLRSREEVGRILLDSGVPTTVLQAAVVIGSGSASFEMLRHLTERLPVMVVPRWVDTQIQPIAIRDVLRYLVGSADMPADVNRGFDIGGPDVLTYADMMQRYAEGGRAAAPAHAQGAGAVARRCRATGSGSITPVPGSLARPLVESLRNTVVCREHDIAAYVPDPPDGLIGFDEAVRLALVRIRDADVATHWSNASVAGVPSDPMPTDPDWAQGTLYVDERSTRVDAPADVLWRVIEGIGGTSGWYSWSLGVDRARAGSTGCGAAPGCGAAGATRSDLHARRRRRLLARRGHRRRRAAAAAGRDEAARAGLARPRHRARRRRRHAVPPARRVRAEGSAGAAPTGGRCTRSTGSCSAACSATSPARPRSARSPRPTPHRRRHRHDRRPPRRRS